MNLLKIPCPRLKYLAVKKRGNCVINSNSPQICESRKRTQPGETEKSKLFLN